MVIRNSITNKYFIKVHVLKSTDGPKTEEDVKYESSIIKEMMDIVANRDSLITLLEEDRLRFSKFDLL